MVSMQELQSHLNRADGRWRREPARLSAPIRPILASLSAAAFAPPDDNGMTVGAVADTEHD
jgi:hypothetical protein